MGRTPTVYIYIYSQHKSDKSDPHPRCGHPRCGQRHDERHAASLVCCSAVRPLENLNSAAASVGFHLARFETTTTNVSQIEFKAFTFDSGRENESGRQNELLWQVFFDGNGETYMKCWEAQNLLKSMFCCDMSNFVWWKWRNLHEMLRSTKSAEKHVLLWHVYFFDGNGETYMKCWEAQNLRKNMFCCDMSFFDGNAKLTWNAEKQVMLRSKKYLLKSMFCCDMSNFFDGKNLNYWCLIGEHSRNTQTGTKRYGRFIFCIYLHDTMETFFGSFLLCW